MATVVRGALAMLYVALFIWSYRQSGFPFDRERILLWIAGATAVVSVGRHRRWMLRFGRDWIPFVVLLAVYDLAYGLVEFIGRPIVVKPLVDSDKLLFGGNVAAVWLQQHITPTQEVGWWEVGVAVIYASHFIVPLAMAGVLWWRSRPRWRQWVTQLLLLSFSAVVVYAVMPTGAPWYAAQEGLIPALDRPVGRGWLKIGLRAAPRLLERGRLFVNPYAALPSLHAAYSFLFALFIYRMVKGRWRILLFLYPVAMAFTLMFGGEHFAIDILAGWALALLASLAGTRLERYWVARKATTSSPRPTVDQAEVEASVALARST